MASRLPSGERRGCEYRPGLSSKGCFFPPYPTTEWSSVRIPLPSDRPACRWARRQTVPRPWVRLRTPHHPKPVPLFRASPTAPDRTESRITFLCWHEKTARRRLLQPRVNLLPSLSWRRERSSPKEYGAHSPPKANQALSHRREYQLVSMISQSAGVRGQGTRALSKISSAVRSSMVGGSQVVVQVVEARGPIQHGMSLPPPVERASSWVLALGT